MPQWLTRWKTLEILAGDGRLQIAMAAGFKSERWPASNRNPGRLPVGIPGRLKSESACRSSFFSHDEPGESELVR